MKLLLENQAYDIDGKKKLSAGAFSKPFHYIDAEDDPPTTCDVELSRDCADSNCVVSAIANYVCVLLNLNLMPI